MFSESRSKLIIKCLNYDFDDVFVILQNNNISNSMRNNTNNPSVIKYVCKTQSTICNIGNIGSKCQINQTKLIQHDFEW